MRTFRAPRGAGICGALLLMVAGASSLSANAFAQSETFTPSNDATLKQEFTVPPGVTQLEVTAVGGAGQAGGSAPAEDLALGVQARRSPLNSP